MVCPCLRQCTDSSTKTTTELKCLRRCVSAALSQNNWHCHQNTPRVKMMRLNKDWWTLTQREFQKRTMIGLYCQMMRSCHLTLIWLRSLKKTLVDIHPVASSRMLLRLIVPKQPKKRQSSTKKRYLLMRFGNLVMKLLTWMMEMTLRSAIVGQYENVMCFNSSRHIWPPKSTFGNITTCPLGTLWNQRRNCQWRRKGKRDNYM